MMEIQSNAKKEVASIKEQVQVLEMQRAEYIEASRVVGSFFRETLMD
jgi:hypothetical protein